jgi:hypothetical protein
MLVCDRRSNPPSNSPDFAEKGKMALLAAFSSDEVSGLAAHTGFDCAPFLLLKRRTATDENKNHIEI